MNFNKNISVSSNYIDKYDNNNDRNTNYQIQSFSQIQTSPSLKYLTQNILPASPSKVYQQKSNHLGHRLSNRNNQLISNNGEVQFFSPRGPNPSQNKFQNPNTYRHQASKYSSSQIELQKQQTQQSDLQIYNEHLEIKEMGGGPGNIQKITQHFFQIKKGNHIPLKQINAISKSQIQKQCLTEQSDIQNSHYFSSSNTFLKGVYMNQKNNLSANNISLLKQQSKINNDRFLTDQSELFQSPAQQSSSKKKFQTYNSMQLDNKKDNTYLDKFYLAKTNAQECQQNKKKSILLRYNSGNQTRENPTNFSINKISKDRTSLDDIQKYYKTDQATQNFQTDEGFINYSIIGNVRSSPMLKRKSIEKNLLLKQQVSSNKNITESKNKVKQQNEINLFQRQKLSSDNLRNNNNNKSENSNMNSTSNTFKQPSALNNFFNIVAASKDNSKFKSQKALNNSNSQNNIMQSDKPTHSRNDSPLQNNNFSPNKTNNFNNQTSLSINKQMCLAATDYQFQKQLRLQEREQKKIRFGLDMFNNFKMEIERLKKAFINKQDPEPILNHYKVNQEICEKTLVLANKCLVFKRSRAPLETLLRIHSKSIELNKQHPNLQLFILLQISKIFIEISSPLLAIPILKVVKRQSFLNMQNEYLMKSYRCLAQCYCTIQKFEIGFGYAAKYLHLSWTCDSANNELGAYEMLGKIFFYLGDARKSAYYHNRMAMNIREDETSSLRKMQIENLKAFHKRRYEIIAAREIKKNRKKLEDQQIDGSLYIISSDEENDLNQLIPEENKDLLSDNRIDFNEQKKVQKHQEQLLQLQNKSKTQIPLRKTPKFDIKSDKGCLMDTQVKANLDIRIEAKKRENLEQFLKKPYEQFIQYKSIKGIGPMRDKLLVSHKSYNKNLSNFQLSQINKKLKSSNIFFTQNQQDKKHQKNGERPDSQIYKINQDQQINQDIQHNIEQSEYWKDSIVKKVEKDLKKMIKNINYLSILRDGLKVYHEEKIREKTFFELEEDNFQSEQEKIIQKMMESKEENSDQYWSHLV